MFPKESPLSIAVYHGNVDMVDLLKKHELLLPHHFPQAFREAAGAGDVSMMRKLWALCGGNRDCLLESESERCKRRCTPLHVAAAAGHLTCVQHLSLIDYLRTTPDCVGDLPLNYAIENGHLVIAEFLIRMYADEVPHTVIRSAINCRRNKLAKMLFHIMIPLTSVIEAVKPMKVAVETGNFHMAEYMLKQYMVNHKVSEKPWSDDIGEALQEVLRINSLTTTQRAKFVVAFQMAGFKVSLVSVLRTVRDNSVAAFICNSLRHPSNKPK